MASAFKTTALLILVLLSGLALSPTMADDYDHDRARHALEAGEILPLRTIFDTIEHDYFGQVIEVELERDDGLWIYEIELLQSTGSLVKLKLDARDGSLIGIKGRDLQSAMRPHRKP